MLIDLCVVFLPARAVLTVFLPNYFRPKAGLFNIPSVRKALRDEFSRA